MMLKTIAIALALTVAAGCSRPAADNSISAPTPTAAKAAGGDTIDKGFVGQAGDSAFVAAVKAAGLEPTFAGPGPYTVLVPDNGAFAKLPAGTLDGLMKPENKPKLVRLLAMHVLPGTILSTDMIKAIDAKGGSATLISMAGQPIKATKSGDRIVLTDASGDKATISSADGKRSNGIVHHIDAVLTPKA